LTTTVIDGDALSPTTLLYALEQRNLKRGIATLCLGGGNGVALAVERT
jgi:acetyl-CoA C-acetyltransferase